MLGKILTIYFANRVKYIRLSTFRGQSATSVILNASFTI
jgi:hypothetical protein